MHLPKILGHSTTDDHTQANKAEEDSFTDLFNTGNFSCPCLNSALLHNIATRASAIQVGEFLSYVASVNRNKEHCGKTGNTCLKLWAVYKQINNVEKNSINK